MTKPFTGIACVAIAVPSIDEVLPSYTEGMGLEIISPIRESKRGFGMKWIELGHNGVTFIELLEPTGTDGPVAKFLSKNPSSHLYQLRFIVEDVEESLVDLESRGVRVIRGQPVPGDPDVGWIHPAATGGALVELLADSVEDE